MVAQESKISRGRGDTESQLRSRATLAPSDLVVVYARQPGIGWQSVTHFAHLAARLLGTRLTVVDSVSSTILLRKLGALLPRRRRIGKLLLIAPIPEYLYAIVDWASTVRRTFETSVLVTDSFWVERIPRIARSRTFVERIFIHDGELVDDWARLTGRPVTWIPVGSDALGLGSYSGDRPVDLLRFGRQPPAWNDDHDTAVAAARHGISFAGRPRFHQDPEDGFAELQRNLSVAKVTLAFSNRVNRELYNHPTREFVSYRWVDAISAGAVVAGTLPRTMTAEKVLWPEATIEVNPNDLDAGLSVIKDYARSWTAEVPMRQYLGALKNLDWRWRLSQMAEEMGVDAPLLDKEIGILQARVQQLTT